MTDLPPLPETDAPWPTGRTGYVALLGRPNVGKSTFLNAVLEFHLAAVSSKPQTTRARCLGVLSEEGSQVCFLDAPGVHRPRHALDEAMDDAIHRALEDADVVLCIADATRAPGDEDALVAERTATATVPCFLAINKTDAAEEAQVEEMASFYGRRLGDAPVFRMAAVKRETLEPVLTAVRSALPVGPFLYPQDSLTDVYERDLGAELIREALLELLRQEVPHSMAVAITRWQERGDRRAIDAELYVERDHHKHIVIGRGGSMIKRIRGRARRKLEELCGARVRLKLWVKVAADWRRKGRRARELTQFSSDRE